AGHVRRSHRCTRKEREVLAGDGVGGVGGEASKDVDAGRGDVGFEYVFGRSGTTCGKGAHHVAGIFFRQEQALVQHDLNREPGVNLVEQQVAVCLPDHERRDVGKIRDAGHDDRVAGDAEYHRGNRAGFVRVCALDGEIAAAALDERDVTGEFA